MAQAELPLKTVHSQRPLSAANWLKSLAFCRGKKQNCHTRRHVSFDMHVSYIYIYIRSFLNQLSPTDALLHNSLTSSLVQRESMAKHPQRFGRCDHALCLVHSQAPHLRHDFMTTEHNAKLQFNSLPQTVGLIRAKMRFAKQVNLSNSGATRSLQHWYASGISTALHWLSSTLDCLPLAEC